MGLSIGRENLMEPIYDVPIEPALNGPFICQSGLTPAATPPIPACATWLLRFPPAGKNNFLAFSMTVLL
jgi:hypothetical protein